MSNFSRFLLLWSSTLNSTQQPNSVSLFKLYFILVHQRIRTVEHLGHLNITALLEQSYTDSNYRTFAGFVILEDLLLEVLLKFTKIRIIVASYEDRELIASDTENRRVIEHITDDLASCS